jgi:hypothetical protein
MARARFLRGTSPEIHGDDREPDSSVAAAARRLGTFGKRHGLSLGGMTIRQLLGSFVVLFCRSHV